MTPEARPLRAYRQSPSPTPEKGLFYFSITRKNLTNTLLLLLLRILHKNKRFRLAKPP